MKLIFISNGRGKSKSRQFTLNGWAKLFLSICLLGLPLTGGIILGLELAGVRYGVMLDKTFAELKANFKQQRAQLAQAEQISESKIATLTQKLGEMQARLIRLDALGEQLIQMANLDDGEFNFSQPPALGGPDEAATEAPVEFVEPTLDSYYQEIALRLDASEDQLLVLRSLLSDYRFQKENTLTGRPIKWGWVSSRYGYRVDPFSGKRVWHNGIDFAGKKGGDVVAIASGVVNWVGEKNGYGQMIELDHGEGYSTRYAHNLKNLVSVGELVKKGQIIALMGSSGRSTGPHVHFEVYKNGRSVDPASYIRRNLR